MLLTLAAIAERLQYTGRDRKRSVRRLFARHGVPMIERGRGVYFVTEQQYSALLEAMTTCSHSDDAGRNSTSAARSASGVKRGTSKNTLRAAIAERTRKRTDRGLKPRSVMSCFTVLAGGRSN
jgi:hypothetical protein